MWGQGLKVSLTLSKIDKMNNVYLKRKEEKLIGSVLQLGEKKEA